ncbi:MAG: Flp pilus assembly complex ATPase component TadA [Phycisphaerales bacterium]|nr:Flp pilus assembly complex ATPase component TadA [Phycisphaerales bacterium]
MLWEPAEIYVRTIPIAFARRYTMLLRQRPDGRHSLVFTRPLPDGVVESVARMLPVPFEVEQIRCDDTTEERILAKLNAAYRRWGGGVAAELVEPRVHTRHESTETIEDLLDDAGRAPVVRIVNALLLEATRLGASDIHLDPTEKDVAVRMRIDGVLEDRHRLPRSIRDEIISRVKVMARMNVAERRMPQDGRISVDIGSRALDLRIASLPNVHGERLVIRLLDTESVTHTLADLKMGDDTQHRYERLIKRPNGIVLVTGPTGSGKTTTLYATLQLLNQPGSNIITIEDPVEYKIHGVSQSQINEKAGLTFARSLRSVLRQDPDIIMLGEIRDPETAIMAMQASLTGHLVLSTLHTNNAASSVTRLLDLGAEPYLVASSLVGVMAQRLLRQLCPRCKAVATAGPLEQQWLGGEIVSTPLIARAVGCEYCRGSGYDGRRGIFELLEINQAVRDAIGRSATADEITSIAIQDGGMRTLQSCAVRAVHDQITSIAEAERVTLGIGNG